MAIIEVQFILENIHFIKPEKRLQRFEHIDDTIIVDCYLYEFYLSLVFPLLCHNDETYANY